ncbi:MAG: hypothetical protein P8180_05310 [Gammaproteobacteria bacterium]
MAKRTGVQTLVALLLSGALAGSQCPPAVAGGVDNQQLLEQIKELRSRLNELERQVEANRKAAATPKPAPERKAVTVDRQQTKPKTPKPEQVKIGGALWLNYARTSFSSASRTKRGDLGFDLLRLDVNGSLHHVLISAQYRWYRYMNVVHHAWIGYDFPHHWQGQLGITQVPFGILPYASHSYWFGVPYYMGLEDDYNAGLKFVHHQGPWKLDLAVFKNAAWGSATDLDRYSFDVVQVGAQQNQEINQLNARVAYRLGSAQGPHAELGLSTEYGRLYNATTDGLGNHWAAAAHMNASFGPWNVQFEAIDYRYNPDNPQGVSDQTVLVGAFGTSHPVAARGRLYVANLARDFRVHWGPISKLTCYNDYSVLKKGENGFADSKLNTLGCLITAKPVYVYVDAIFGKNMTFLGDNGDGMAAGDPNASWHNRFNINLEYYF